MSLTRVVLIGCLVLLASVGPAGCGSESGPPPEAGFSAFPRVGYVPSEVQFTDESLWEVTEWEWDFDGDGEVDSELRNPRFTYSTPGTYTIILTVKGPGGEDTKTKKEYVQLASTPCGADFIASTNRSDDGLVVQFTDQSTGYVAAWAWDFDGDGGIDSTEQSPTHIYEDYGSYTVSLTVTAPECDDTETKVDFVEYIAPPVAAFVASATTGEAPVAVQFEDRSTGDMNRWSWDFDGDGVADSTVRNPDHTYAVAGTYTVRLTVTGAGGSDTETRSAYIEVAPAAGPTPTASPSPTPTPVPQACLADYSYVRGEYNQQLGGVLVQFTDTSVGVGGVVGRTWSFGDGKTGSAANPAHLYTKNKDYIVTLTVEWPGCTDSATKVITIVGCPT